MKIWTVTFNDGGWHTSRPEYQVVDETKEESIEKVLEKNPRYRSGYDKWASEFKMKRHIIEKRISKILIFNNKLTIFVL